MEYYSKSQEEFIKELADKNPGKTIPFEIQLDTNKIKELYLSILSATFKGTLVEEFNPITKTTKLTFPDKKNDTTISLDKSFIETFMPDPTSVMINSLKKGFNENPDHDIISQILYVTDIFSNKLFEGSNPQKQCFNFLKSLASQLHKNKDNPKFIAAQERINAHLVYAANGNQTDIPDNYMPATLTFLKFGLVDVDTLMETPFFEQFDFDKLYELHKDGIIPANRFIDITGEDKFKDKFLNVQESLLYWKSQNDSSSPFREESYSKKDISTNIRRLEGELNALSSIPTAKPLIVDLFLNDELEEEIFDKIFGRTNIKNLDSNQIVDLLCSSYGDKIKIASDELLNMYGTRLSGSQLITLANFGRVDHEKLIDLPDYKSVNTASPNLAVNPHDLIEFYTSDRTLYNLYTDGKLTKDFCLKLTNLMKENLDSTELEITQAKIVSSTRRDSEFSKQDPEPILINYFKMGLIAPERLKGFVSTSALEDFFLDEKLNMQEMLQLVASGVIRMKDTNKFFTSDEIIENILNGTISQDCLKAFNKPTIAEKLQELYIDNKCPIDLFMKAYLEYDIIPTDMLNDSFEMKEPDVDITQFITKESSIDKVRDLFTNYHISYEDLSTLLHTEIIDEDTFNDLKNAIDKAEFYRRLREEKYIEIESKDVNKQESHHPIIPGNKKKKSNIDFELEKLAFEDLYETPSISMNNMPTLVSLNTATGKPTTLNGYLIIPIEKYGLVAFEKFEASNSLFLMPYQQADYFLHGNMKMLDTSTIDTENRNKKTLKEMESVKIANHTKNFWKHVIDYSCELSEEARNDLKPNGRYSPQAKEYIDSMSTRYIENSQELR